MLDRERDCKYSKDNAPAISPGYCIPTPGQCEECNRYVPTEKEGIMSNKYTKRAKGTVISLNDLMMSGIDFNQPMGNWVGQSLGVQAKATYPIAFNAGYEKLKGEYDEDMREHRKAGIKEVVEWIREHISAEANYTDNYNITRSWVELPRGLWQAKLKEWGL